ncbi:hypothetical protein SCALM49S_04805 [Streptomyces californicus]
MDQARTTRCRNAVSVRASAAGRAPGPQGGRTAVSVASMQRPFSPASWIRYSVVTAPERWLWRSPPLGRSAKNSLSRAGSLRSPSRRSSVLRSAGVVKRAGACAPARGEGSARASRMRRSRGEQRDEGEETEPGREQG